MSRVTEAITYARNERHALVRMLKQLIRFPTVSSEPQRGNQSRAAAVWLAERLKEAGLTDARVVATPGLPIVAASWRGAPGRPTLLMYGHYDVQPPNPVRQWRTPPFHPVVKGAYLYGCGASDNKGAIVAQIQALGACLRTSGYLPVNVVCIYEGEEETGSPNLRSFIARNRSGLQCDVAAISDTNMLGIEQPTLTYALRGGVSVEVEIAGPRGDLHSGSYGGAVLNPIQALATILAHLHNEEGRVAVPGFYDQVARVEDADRREMASAAPPESDVLQHAGVQRGWGEPGYTLHERVTIRPALTINGITGGYQGPGGKSVIPSRALAKLSVRLVPQQDPGEIGHLLKQQIERLTPPAVRVSVSVREGARPVVLDRNHAAFKAAVLACRKAWGKPPVWLRSGGSIPAVSILQATLGIPTILLGLSLPDDNRHAPNERVHLPTLYRGIQAYVWLLAGLAVDGHRSQHDVVGKRIHNGVSGNGARRAIRTDLP